MLARKLLYKLLVLQVLFTCNLRIVKLLLFVLGVSFRKISTTFLLRVVDIVLVVGICSLQQTFIERIS